MAVSSWTTPGANPRQALANAGYRDDPGQNFSMQDRLMRQARRGNLSFQNGSATMDVTGPHRSIGASVSDPRAVQALEAVQARHTARDNVAHGPDLAGRESALQAMLARQGGRLQTPPGVSTPGAVGAGLQDFLSGMQDGRPVTPQEPGQQAGEGGFRPLQRLGARPGMLRNTRPMARQGGQRYMGR